MARISVKVNGTQQSHEVEPRLLLVHYLRDVLGLTGTHVGCDTSQCGSCTVMVDGRTAKSCVCPQGIGAAEGLRFRLKP